MKKSTITLPLQNALPRKYQRLRTKFKHLPLSVFKYLMRMEFTCNRSGQYIRFANDKEFEDLDKMVKYALQWNAGYVPNTDRYRADGVCMEEQIYMESRSMRDLYLMTRVYFPEATIFDIREVLAHLFKENNLYTWVCGTYRRIMFRHKNYFPGYSEDYAVRAFALNNVKK